MCRASRRLSAIEDVVTKPEHWQPPRKYVNISVEDGRGIVHAWPAKHYKVADLPDYDTHMAWCGETGHCISRDLIVTCLFCAVLSG